jgi:hypothetical protein
MRDTLIGVCALVFGSLMHGGFWWDFSRMKNGAVRGQHGGWFFRDQDPVRYWILITVHIFGALLALILILFGLLSIGVGLGLFD